MKESKNQKKNKKSDHKSVPHISSKNKANIKSSLPAVKKSARWWFYAVLVLIPLLIIVLLEILLRIFNYGYDIPQWIDAGSDKYIINPDLGKRYFSNVNFVPVTNEDVFDKEKKTNAFRVFIIGESSAAGYPYMPLGSFSRYIRKRLELTYPNNTIEVVNVSMTGVSSYVLLDIMPGILEQKPDLILIYTGHNEYYGALGAGSAETLGGSRAAVKAALYLNNFKVTQLARNSLAWVVSIFNSSDKKQSSGALMARMAKDQQIFLNSDQFNSGLNQFIGNLKDILEMAKEENVPVVLGRLVSNLKDQKPFISVNNPENKSADKVYAEAQSELRNNNIYKADSLFRLAKDLDVLRFRAPEKINSIIQQLGKEFGSPVVPIDSLFGAVSPGGIAGDNLFTDHLHPNLFGYQLIGKAFYEAMVKNSYLPEGTEAIPLPSQDSTTRANFIFTELDSVMGNDIIAMLKSDFPFTKHPVKITPGQMFNPRNFIDSIALEYIENKITWADAHVRAAAEYLRRDDVINHLAHMNVLIYQYPTLKDYNSALKYFYESNKINPADFTTRRIGIINYYIGKYDEAITLLNTTVQQNHSDADSYYYLSLAYMQKKNYKEALEAVKKCLDIRPDYHEGKNVMIQIQNAVRQQG